MASAFLSSLARNINRVKSETNDAVYKITLELFRRIVERSPSPDHPGPFAKGLLANQWYPQEGGFSSEKGTDTSSNGIASLNRIAAITRDGGSEFLGKNGLITLSNNVDHAYRAEYAGWPAPEWSGKTGGDGRGGPYRMVALSLQEVAARYK